MLDKEKMIELLEINDNNKFRINGHLKFKCGLRMGFWFQKNKEEILKSNDPLCIKLKEQYQNYVCEFQRKRKIYKNVLGARASYTKRVIDEFIKYPSLKKFEECCDITFFDGTNMYKWFAENLIAISRSKSPEHIEIMRQYELYISKKNTKVLLEQRKLKYMFLKEKNIEKFSLDSDILFPNGSLMNRWFNSNVMDIIASNELIDIEIKKQYESYMIFSALREEFLMENDFSKFDEYGNARFSSGAVMYFWWDRYKEEILNSTYYVDKDISNQYLEYQEKINKT